MKRLTLKTVVVAIFAAVLFLSPLTSCNKDDKNLNASPYDSEQKKNLHIAGAVGASVDAASARKRWNVDANVFGRLVANADEKRTYIKHYATTAINEMRQFAIPASITLSQAVLESDAGESYNAITGNAHFGIKCKSDFTGLEIDCFVNPDLIEQGEFAAYKSVWESYRSHSKFLAERSYYQKCFECKDYKCWAYELEKAGYGGNDKDYAEKLIAVIEYYGLQQYDDFVNETTNTAPNNGLVVKTWLLNNSHGSDTKGKRFTFSKPLRNGKKTVYEFEMNRQVVAKLVKRCNDLGLQYKVLVPESNDISLKERVKRANRFENQLGNTALLTIDHNAAPFDNENKPSLASAYEFQTKSVASGMESHHFKGSEMEQFNKRLETYVNHALKGFHQRGVKKSNFYTLRKSTMPATILELCFFDNRDEMNQYENIQDILVECILRAMCDFTPDIEYIGNGVQG